MSWICGFCRFPHISISDIVKFSLYTVERPRSSLARGWEKKFLVTLLKHSYNKISMENVYNTKSALYFLLRPKSLLNFSNFRVLVPLSCLGRVGSSHSVIRMHTDRLLYLICLSQHVKRPNLCR